MPKRFNQCVKNGGKVRTKRLSGGKYMHICILPKGKRGKRGGRTVAGEIKRRKTK